MNKTELVKEIAERTQASQKEVGTFLGTFVEVVGEQLEKGNTVQLIGFGSFETRKRSARTGRNPRNPEEIIEIPESKAPAFKAGKLLKERVNK